LLQPASQSAARLVEVKNRKYATFSRMMDQS
jgi:hypothetical protein